MHQRHRIGLLSAAAATLVAPLAHAQQTPAPTPTPAPRPALLPGAENFDLSGPARAPRPTIIATSTPTPSATPRVTPPVVLVTPTPAPRAAATPAARPILPETKAHATPTPEASPTALPLPSPSAIPAPVATATPAAVAQPAGGLPWLWISLGIAAALAIGLAGWLLGRRARAEPKAEAPEPVARPTPPTPAPPPIAAPVPAAPRPVARPAPAGPADPISVIFHPRHIEVTDKGALLDFEMELRNLSGASADGLKIALLMGSANPGQDGLIAGFHAAPAAQLAGPPVDLPAGEGGRVPGKLMLEAERMHIVTVGERPMFVPIVMVDLRWRGGLTLRRHAADFMVGTAGQGAKLGPIWLDRGAQRQSGLAASRYYVRASEAAA